MNEIQRSDMADQWLANFEERKEFLQMLLDQRLPGCLLSEYVTVMKNSPDSVSIEFHNDNLPAEFVSTIMEEYHQAMPGNH